ncbi:MAG: sulfatase-like hydrolase/transferase [Bacteroidia bacterium]|nr:sulfatase-like hydrolase/transferase [Bacteroidia bacterium]
MNYSFIHLHLLIKRLILAYSLLLVCRIIFFVAYYNLFDEFNGGDLFLSFFWGLRFDTVAICYLYSPVILLHIIPGKFKCNAVYQSITLLFFMMASTLILLLNLIDVGYFDISGKRSGFELIAMQGNGSPSVLTYILDYWHLLLTLIGLMAFSFRFYPRLSTAQQSVYIYKPAIELVIMVVVIAFTFIGARGSFGLKPLHSMDAPKLTLPQLSPLTLNTPFQFLISINQKGLSDFNYLDDAKAEEIAGVIRTATGNRKFKHVVLIIVESLGKEYVGYYNQNKGYTPFLDSLFNNSKVYHQAYANGKRSIEGIPAICAGIPALMDNDFISSVYQSNRIDGAGYYLKKAGYQTTFYHGGINGTMSFDRFWFNTTGGDYKGKNEYKGNIEDDDGNWGIFDFPYLNYVANELQQESNPFFATIFTLSSHHPYTLPKANAKQFKGGTLPIHATIEYADFALKNFFNQVKNAAWYNDCLFIITADHSSKNELDYYNTSTGKFAIPLMVYYNGITHEDNYETIEQLSIKDLILNATLPNGTPYFSLSGNHAIQYEAGQYQLIKYPYMYQLSSDKAFALYDIKHDSLLKNNLLKSRTDSLKNVQLILDEELKAFLQVYSKRMNKNKFYLNTNE